MEYRVVIIDDHPIFRQGLTTILSTHSGLSVVGEAGSMREGLEVVARTNPNLILLDYELQHNHGICHIDDFKINCLNRKAITLSTYSEIYHITTSLKSGADGYILKKSTREILIKGIESVLNGGIFIDPSVSTKNNNIILCCLANKNDGSISNHLNLSPREIDVLRLLASGKQLDEIASTLYISKKTVEVHRYNITKKIGVSRAIDLYKFALSSGIIVK